MDGFEAFFWLPPWIHFCFIFDLQKINQFSRVRVIKTVSLFIDILKAKIFCVPVGHGPDLTAKKFKLSTLDAD